MKGTIDIQIKHKDGSIENRHEHNVIFDLPALRIKARLAMPNWVHLLCGNSLSPNISSAVHRDYYYFGLSEDEFSLTQPEYRPFALVGVQQNATKWYQSVPSRVVSEKSITLQESWTIGAPMTLKGVAVHYVNPESHFYNATNGKACFIDNTLYCANIYDNNNNYVPYQKADFSTSIFSYKNNYANGFASSEKDRTHCSIGCVPYKLANSSERIAFLSSNGKRSTYLPLSTSASIAIYKYPDDNTLLRSFKLSQFTGFTTGYYDTTFLMNTGTKNYLFEVNKANSGSTSSLIQSITVWQIPDAPIAEGETIAPVKTDFLSEFWPTTAGYTYSPTIVVGNYIRIFEKLFKIDDTLAVTQYHGDSGMLSGSYSSSMPYFSLSDSGEIPTLYSSNASNKWAESYGSFSTYTYNRTAANFSTPIVLAEGDVLTVSYKIEVA